MNKGLYACGNVPEVGDTVELVDGGVRYGKPNLNVGDCTVIEEVYCNDAGFYTVRIPNDDTARDASRFKLISRAVKEVSEPWPIGTRLQNTDQLSKDYGTTGKVHAYNDTEVTVEWTPGVFHHWKRNKVRVWDGVDVTRGEKQPKKSLGQICYEAGQKSDPNEYPSHWTTLGNTAQAIWESNAQAVVDAHYYKAGGKIDSLEQEIERLNKNHAQRELDEQELVKRIDLLVDENNKLHTRNQELETIKEELERDCSSLDKARERIRTENTELHTKNAALIQENDLLTRKIEEVVAKQTELGVILSQKEQGVSLEVLTSVLNGHDAIVSGFGHLVGRLIEESNSLKEELREDSNE